MKNSFFTKAIWDLLVRKILASIITVMAILYRPGLMVRDTIKLLGSLIAIEMVGSPNNRGQVEALNPQKQGSMCRYCNEWHCHSSSQARGWWFGRQVGLTHIEL